MSLEVVTPGLYSLLVDAGRPHSRSLGVPLGGAADRRSYVLGNALVGNSPGAVALELTLLGPTLRFTTSVGCVILGAPFRLNSSLNQPREVGRTFTALPGEVLDIGPTEQGVRGYLCVHGGFHATPILGSSSGFQPIVAGQRLGCRVSQLPGRALSDQAVNWATEQARILRVLPGPQRDWFDDRILQTCYSVSTASNRMGLRLLGDSLSRRAGELASEAVAPGAVQITNDGLPIILGVDGQTIGGYPKPLHVISADLDKLALLRPGSQVRFVEVSQEEAEALADQAERELHGWLTRLRL